MFWTRGADRARSQIKASVEWFVTVLNISKHRQQPCCRHRMSCPRFQVAQLVLIGAAGLCLAGSQDSSDVPVSRPQWSLDELNKIRADDPLLRGHVSLQALQWADPETMLLQSDWRRDPEKTFQKLLAMEPKGSNPPTSSQLLHEPLSRDQTRAVPRVPYSEMQLHPSLLHNMRNRESPMLHSSMPPGTHPEQSPSAHSGAHPPIPLNGSPKKHRGAQLHVQPHQEGDSGELFRPDCPTFLRMLKTTKNRSGKPYSLPSYEAYASRHPELSGQFAEAVERSKASIRRERVFGRTGSKQRYWRRCKEHARDYAKQAQRATSGERKRFLRTLANEYQKAAEQLERDPEVGAKPSVPVKRRDRPEDRDRTGREESAGIKPKSSVHGPGDRHAGGSQGQHQARATGKERQAHLNWLKKQHTEGSGRAPRPIREPSFMQSAALSPTAQRPPSMSEDAFGAKMSAPPHRGDTQRGHHSSRSWTGSSDLHLDSRLGHADSILRFGVESPSRTDQKSRGSGGRR